MINVPLVSICCITYNHADFIEECLDGFLRQHTNFQFEILIHDDASTDGTSVIIEEYSKNHENLFKPIIQNENQYSKGIRAINSTFNFPRAKGKYIAICEGDDYWTDPLKLQKQVDFLEENPGFSGVGTNSLVYFENTGEEKLFNKDDRESDLNFENFLKERKFHTASFLFRNTLQYPKDFTKVLSGDRLLFLLVALQGKIKYFTDVTCIYRKNDGGISSRATSKSLIKDLYFIKILKNKLNTSQLIEMRIFIYQTIFKYSHKIYLKHFVRVSILLLYYSGLAYRSRRLIQNSFQKVIW
tara:strand:- start:4387 stop:5283 length:897 start_codon:yes stop_codon:yes gene_type:complete